MMCSPVSWFRNSAADESRRRLMPAFLRGLIAEVERVRADGQLAQGGLERRSGIAVTAFEQSQGLGMREVQPPFARQQKFAAHRRHGVKHLHRQRNARTAEHLGRHQPGGAAADDGNAGISPHGIVFNTHKHFIFDSTAGNKHLGCNAKRLEISMEMMISSLRGSSGDQLRLIIAGCAVASGAITSAAQSRCGPRSCAARWACHLFPGH